MSILVIGLLFGGLVVLVAISILIVSRIKKFFKKSWVPYAYLAIGIFPLIEIVHILSSKKFPSTVTPFLIFWVVFLGFCIGMFLKEKSGNTISERE